jgi:hypothetical protein
MFISCRQDDMIIKYAMLVSIGLVILNGGALSQETRSTQTLAQVHLEITTGSCRYTARTQLIAGQHYTAVGHTTDDTHGSLVCPDIDASDASFWSAAVVKHEAQYKNILVRLTQRPNQAELDQLSGNMLEASRVLACAHLRGGMPTMEQAQDAMEVVAAIMPNDKTVAAELSLLKQMKAASVFTVDATATCSTIGTSSPIPDDVWQRMQGKSWHAKIKCPARDALSLVRVPYLDFTGKQQMGQLVVARSAAREIITVFDEIYKSGKFQFASIKLIDDFDGDDQRSMNANNTSAFNCRTIAGSAAMSEHSHGLAIDINPIQNPYVNRSRTSPAAGVKFDTVVKRQAKSDGLIKAGDVVTTAFARLGWKWGGEWAQLKDYQHFSKNGR